MKGLNASNLTLHILKHSSQQNDKCWQQYCIDTVKPNNIASIVPKKLHASALTTPSTNSLTMVTIVPLLVVEHGNINNNNSMIIDWLIYPQGFNIALLPRELHHGVEQLGNNCRMDVCLFAN